MKIKQMEEICKAHKGICKNCPLLLPNNIWQKNLISWCLKDYKKTSIYKYQKALQENNVVLASKIMQDYQDKEKLLGIEKEEQNERNNPSNNNNFGNSSTIHSV